MSNLAVVGDAANLPDSTRVEADGLDQKTAPFLPEGKPMLSYRVGRLIITRPDGNRQEHVVDLPHVRIGSAPNNDICVQDPSVSRFHCELRHSPEGFVLRDLGSTNGTVVAGMRVREALIQDEVTVQLGRTALRFIPGEEETQINPSKDVKFGALVGRSTQMREIFGVLAKIGATDLTVTLQGETGTGKDLVARAIHDHSPRKNGPFIVFDAGAVASNLIESELFGHEKGAFTGATEQRQGAFELADGGTLFIDEIGELALELQPKLLRALEQREIQRVGGSRRIPVDVRVVCATNRSLLDEVKKGRFRDDVYYRISVVVLALPALRERREDIELLVKSFLDNGDPPMSIGNDAISVLQNYDWPGNVRELRNVIEAACAMCNETILHAKDLIFAHDRDINANRDGAMSLAGKTLESIEQAAIAQTLAHCGGNRSAAARALGIAPSTLYLKLKKYDIV
ncbi:MAG: sigma 54-interacting transcriptional regulator [Deltaproteobacteria bacterium]|nr:sigma 54-interacting transcriptional regulator [Deltaproteobacteria bacterium]